MKKLKAFQFGGTIIAHYSQNEAVEAYSNEMTVSILEAQRMAKPLPDTHIIHLLPEQVDRVERGMINVTERSIFLLGTFYEVTLSWYMTHKLKRQPGYVIHNTPTMLF